MMKLTHMTHEERMEYYANVTMRKTMIIADWVTFFGTLTVLSIIGIVLYLVLG